MQQTDQCAVSINDFIQVWRKLDRIEDIHPSSQTWQARLRQHGYVNVILPIINGDLQMVKAVTWCEQHIGNGHFCFFSGISFWFENTEDAAVFRLANSV